MNGPGEVALQEALRAAGDASGVRSARPLGGGCINNAQRVETGQRVYFFKWNADPLPDMFTSEARGLALLAATNTVRVPAVLAVGEAEGHRPAYLLLEWLEASASGGGSKNQAERLGEQLAALHRAGPHAPVDEPSWNGVGQRYGLAHDNYLGSTRQVNGWAVDWVEFFATARLQPQMELAVHNGRMPSPRRSRLERLIEHLPDLLGGIERRPSLIHGDLWGGNVTAAPDGLALIDPAVSYSDREAEIAYTELFGGFPSRFYAGYQSAWPLEPGYPDRRDIYNLYHLLNHLNLFGESYGSSVDAVLSYYE